MTVVVASGQKKKDRNQNLVFDVTWYEYRTVLVGTYIRNVLSIVCSELFLVCEDNVDNWKITFCLFQGRSDFADSKYGVFFCVVASGYQLSVLEWPNLCTSDSSTPIDRRNPRDSPPHVVGRDISFPPTHVLAPMHCWRDNKQLRQIRL